MIWQSYIYFYIFFVCDLHAWLFFPQMLWLCCFKLIKLLTIYFSKSCLWNESLQFHVILSFSETSIYTLKKTANSDLTELEGEIEIWPMEVPKSTKPSDRDRDAVQVGENFHNYQGEIWLLLQDMNMKTFLQLSRI